MSEKSFLQIYLYQVQQHCNKSQSSFKQLNKQDVRQARAAATLQNAIKFL